MNNKINTKTYSRNHWKSIISILIPGTIILFVFSSCMDKTSFYGFLNGNMDGEPVKTRITTWGDQGDNSYCNPVLNADYPDIDIEQLDDTFYMIASKQHMAPGMVILESYDLVNWTTINHVWKKLSWGDEYNWDQMRGYGIGVYAGDLARFYYSLDGKKFIEFGTEFIIKMGERGDGFSNWSGDSLGFFCWNEISEAGYLDVDWFVYDYYDGPCRD